MNEQTRTELVEAFDAMDAAGLHRVSAQIRVADKVRTVDAWDAGTAGLVVTKVIDTRAPASEWAITHTPSGLRTSPGFESRTIAVRWARALASLADWDRAPELVAADDRCRELVETLLALSE